ncbi:DUF4112 domain-containing protein [Alysiella crassa]|uniref:DUF4112 domain-containing protein n=1 Tax=Alysiella crassa TaxID=153491 RepID=A0A376BTU4_9NEIS|nr:DUF4112 domain-containing protein [Alysiella crassa]UOP05797.1 DUF4112 domain-containing protein [Alysiella crassa]SSY80213.1 Uncharacterised protein [Alysiella crassa]
MNTKDKQNALQNSRSFQLGKQIKKYLDEYYLDGVIGLIPFVGSALSHCFNLVYIYIALVKLRSKRLTLVIIFNGLKDMVLGFIPILGTVLDFFYKSNKQNFELIEQFAAGNPDTIRQVNQRAAMAGVGILALCVAAYYLVKFGWFVLVWVFNTLMGLF